MSNHQHPGSFETTQWSEIVQAAEGSPTQARRSFSRLCEKYWFPVYAFLRRSGQSEADAEDLTQAFFLDLIENNKLATADPERGRFRSFLRTSCQNFVRNAHRYRNAQRRGGDVKHSTISWDMSVASTRYHQQSCDQWSAEALFDRGWALEILDQAIGRLAEQYTLRDQSEWFAALRPFIAPAGPMPSHQSVADSLGVSVGSVKTAVHRLRKRFGEALQEEVAETLVDRGDVKDEIKILLDALSGV